MTKTSDLREPSGNMRNVLLLSASQAIVGSQQALIISVGALIGVTLAPDPRLATVPTTAMLTGLALGVGPAVYAIHRLGRTRAFILGALVSVTAGLVAVLSIAAANFLLFCFALFLGGAGAAFGQQYRFAAADSAPLEKKGSAVSWVLAGGVLAGFLGPALAYYGRLVVPGVEYAGSFLGMSGLAVIGIIILSQTKLPRLVADKDMSAARPFGQIIRMPEVFVPVVTGMASYGLMTFVMVAAPLAMVVVCGYPKESAAFAIQWHIVAMYAPSFFTGSIISRIGARATTGIGLMSILACAFVALNGTTILNFDIALVLLGLGWNFGFIGSTALLAQGYRPEDAARAQAINEQLVFGTMAIASISSGVLLQTIGWQSVNILAIPVGVGAIALLAWGDWRARQSGRITTGV